MPSVTKKSASKADQLRRVEAGLQESIELLKAVVESTAVGILVIGRKFNVLAVNQNYLKFWKLPANWADIPDYDERARMVAVQTSAPEAFMARAHELVENPEFATDDLIETLDGRFVRRIAQPYRVGDIIAGRLYTYLDVTEQEFSRARAEAATRAKSVFLASMSHEIRTPLNGLIGVTSLMQQTSLTNEQRELLEIIITSGETLLTIINNILDLSKIEAGKVELHNDAFDLRACIEEALDIVSGIAAEKQLELAYFMDPTVPETIKGDAVQLRQILLNLLQNAIKFTDAGEVIVHITSEPLDKSTPLPHDLTKPLLMRHLLHISVQDTGIGIASDRMVLLFKSFSQADASISSRYGGTGLGLAISKQLAELMGGAMWAESDGPGKGAIFHFTISAESVPETRYTQIHLEQTHFKGKRLLILGNNQANRLIISHFCKVWGAIPRLASSGKEALNWIYHGDSFDLAILDLQIADMNTGRLASRIHRECPNLPLVLLTTLSPQQQNYPSSLFSDKLNKPIKVTQLYEVLTNFFSGQAQAVAKPSTFQRSIDTNLEKKYPLRILITEDNAVNQRVATLMLNKLGYQPDLAGNGRELLALHKQHPYNIILLDMHLPDMDGEEVIRSLRAGEANTNHPYIIAVSADSFVNRGDYLFSIGVDDYLSKPFRLEQLLRILEHYLVLQDLVTSPSLSSDAEPYSIKQEHAIQMDLVSAWIVAIGSRKTFLKVIESFLNNSPRLIQDLQQAIQDQDWKNLRILAYVLKSESGNVGAVHLASLLEDAEMSAIRILQEPSPQLDHIPELTTSIQQEYQRACLELRQILTQQWE
jgi:signal transduction histidine kinase/CheY-like chemotaxis protein